MLARNSVVVRIVASNPELVSDCVNRASKVLVVRERASDIGAILGDVFWDKKDAARTKDGIKLFYAVGWSHLAACLESIVMARDFRNGLGRALDEPCARCALGNNCPNLRRLEALAQLVY